MSHSTILSFSVFRNDAQDTKVKPTVGSDGVPAPWQTNANSAVSRLSVLGFRL